MIKNYVFSLFILIAVFATPVIATTTDLTLGKGSKEISIPRARLNLLRGFHFYFDRGDHHIKTIEVMPKLNGRAKLAFSDKNFDDLWEIHTLFEGASFSNNQEVKGICNGPCNISLNKPRGDFIFVLQGFRFSFRGINIDHHLKRLLIDENNGNLALEYSDKSRNDPYDYHIKYTWVPRNSMRLAVRQSGSSSGKQTAKRLENLERSVIRGFSFEFNSKDHHVKRIGAMIKDKYMIVDFSDKGKDDRFRWWVDHGQIIGAGPVTKAKPKPKPRSSPIPRPRSRSKPIPRSQKLNTKVLITK